MDQIYTQAYQYTYERSKYTTYSLNVFVSHELLQMIQIQNVLGSRQVTGSHDTRSMRARLRISFLSRGLKTRGSTSKRVIKMSDCVCVECVCVCALFDVFFFSLLYLWCGFGCRFSTAFCCCVSLLMRCAPPLVYQTSTGHLAPQSHHTEHNKHSIAGRDTFIQCNNVFNALELVDYYIWHRTSSRTYDALNRMYCNARDIMHVCIVMPLTNG